MALKEIFKKPTENTAISGYRFYFFRQVHGTIDPALTELKKLSRDQLGQCSVETPPE